MTFLILSLWAAGIASLILFAVYRGRSPAKESGAFVNESAEHEMAFQKIVKATGPAGLYRSVNTGEYKAVPSDARGGQYESHRGHLVATGSKAGKKGIHAHVVMKPGATPRSR